MKKCSDCAHWHRTSDKYGDCDIACQGLFTSHVNGTHTMEHTIVRHQNRSACKKKFEENKKVNE